MDYVTISKLQSKLDGDANQTTVRKLIDKMAQDGFVEATSNRRLGMCRCIMLMLVALQARTILSYVHVHHVLSQASV